MESRVLSTIFFIAFVIIAWALPASCQEYRIENGIDPSLELAFEESGSADFIVVMKSQIEINSNLVRGTKTQKAKIVFERLKTHSHRTQEAVISFLNAKEIPFKSYYIVNVLCLHGNKDLAEEILAFPGVKAILADPLVTNDLPKITEYKNQKNPEDLEWGLERIGVEYAWELGYKGSGVVVGGQDTGYDWEHSALKEKYRGWVGGKAQHNYNWHDAIRDINPLHNDSIIDPSNNPCGLSISIPCDDHGHGTHTMGTMVGENENNKIGVAPDAKWIGCRNMERGFGKPSTYIECFEWFLAPTDTFGLNPDPSMAPHVINNSWSCPEIEGCNSSNWHLLETALNNLRISGVVIVVSAGNLGSKCSTIRSPAAMFENSLTVGAIAPPPGSFIAEFSSWGPVTSDGSNRLKPDVVAPGVDVRSAFPGEEYRTWNGTSLAGPHVAGLVALLISANPDLEGDVEVLESIIKTTADDLYDERFCGSFSGLDSPNHIYGFGAINVEKAIAKALDYKRFKNDVHLAEAFIYPNPADSHVFIETSGIKGEAKISIHDFTGKRVLEQPLILDTFSRFKLDLSSLEGGIYYYLIRQGSSHLVSGKLVMN